MDKIRGWRKWEITPISIFTLGIEKKYLYNYRKWKTEIYNFSQYILSYIFSHIFSSINEGEIRIRRAIIIITQKCSIIPTEKLSKVGLDICSNVLVTCKAEIEYKVVVVLLKGENRTLINTILVPLQLSIPLPWENILFHPF